MRYRDEGMPGALVCFNAIGILSTSQIHAKYLLYTVDTVVSPKELEACIGKRDGGDRFFSVLALLESS